MLIFLPDENKHFYFEVEVRYPPSVQVVKSFKNFSEVQRHLLLCQVAPAHYIIQESPLVRPGKNQESIFYSNVRET